jgi:hypothetical protein
MRPTLCLYPERALRSAEVTHLSRSALAILAIAMLVSSGLWLSMRAARLAEVEVLPAYCRRRVRWWQHNATHVQLGCALAALAAACMQVGSSLVG